MAKHAPMMAQGLAVDGQERQIIDVATAAVDTRPITPKEIQSHPNLLGLTDVAAELLADQVSARLVEMINDREPWRQEYVIDLAGWGDQDLTLPRYPIETPIADSDGESVPEVVLLLGGSFGTLTDVFDADRYEISGDSTGCRKALYKDTAWPWTTLSSRGVRADPLPGHETSDIQVGNGAGMGVAGSLTCGYIMPGQLGENQAGPREATPSAAVETWQPATVYGVGQSVSFGDARGSFVYPTDRQLAQAFIEECTIAGTSGALVGDEPDWSPVIGSTLDDNGVEWTTRAAQVLPILVRQALFLMSALIHKENKGGECDGGAWGKIAHMIGKACI